jgi:hypothetical protein
MKLRFEWDKVTGINPPFNPPSPPIKGPHMPMCSCMACDAARLERMNSTYVINDWGDLHIGLGERKQRERSRIARSAQEQRAENERAKLEHKSEQARMDQIRASYGRGRER